MKSFVTVVLTIFITGILVLLGISLSSKSLIIETVNIMIKEEVVNKIIEDNHENNELKREEVQEKVNEVMDENPKIKDFVNKYFDKFIDVMNDKIDIKDINLDNEVENLIEESRPILDEYGITITDETKDEIMSFVKSEDTNNNLSETVEEIKTSVPVVVRTTFKGFAMFLSFKFKMLLVSFVIIFLVLIAWLKKSYYKWTINLGVPCSLNGTLFLGLVMLFNKVFELEDITLDISTMNNYGVINLVLGAILLIVYIVLSNVLNKDKEIVVE